jgi:hypothetical protein
MSTSQNGWPALSVGSRLLHTWVIPGKGDDTLIKVRNGSAGFLLCHLALCFDSKVEVLDEPVLDDWGYAYRPIRGYSDTLSNHSSGTAIDLNATDHPLGREDTFTAAEEATIERFLRRYSGCIRWGGDYRGRKDEMHFELDRPLAACEVVARQLLDSRRGQMILKANPGQRAVILS